jgi:hypothetical protein
MAAERSVANNGALISDKFRLPESFFAQLPQLLDEAESIFQTRPYKNLVLSDPAYDIARDFWTALLARKDDPLEALISLVFKFLHWRLKANSWASPIFLHNEMKAMASIYSLLDEVTPEFGEVSATSEPLLIECGRLLVAGVKGQQLDAKDVGEVIIDGNTLQIFTQANLASLFDMTTQHVLYHGSVIHQKVYNGIYYLRDHNTPNISECLSSAAYDSTTFSFFVSFLFKKSIFSLEYTTWVSILNKVLSFDKVEAKKMLASVLSTKGLHAFFKKNFFQILTTLKLGYRSSFLAYCVEFAPSCVPKTFALLPLLPQHLQSSWVNSFSELDVASFFSQPHNGFLSAPSKQLIVDTYLYSLDKFSVHLEKLRGEISEKREPICWLILYVYEIAREHQLSLPEDAEIKLARFEQVLLQSSPSQLAALFSSDMSLRASELHEMFRTFLVELKNPDLKMQLALASLICDGLRPEGNESICDITENNIKESLTEPQYQRYLVERSKTIFSYFKQLSPGLHASQVTNVGSSRENETSTYSAQSSSTPVRPTQRSTPVSEETKKWIKFFDYHNLVLTLCEEQLETYRHAASTTTDVTKYQVDAIETYARYNQYGQELWSECSAMKPEATLIEIAIEVFNQYLESFFRRGSFFHSAESTALLKDVRQYLQKTHQEHPYEQRELLPSELLVGVLATIRKPVNERSQQQSVNPWRDITNGRAAGILRVIVQKLVAAANLEPAPSLAVAPPQPGTNTPSPSSSSS